MSTRVQATGYETEDAVALQQLAMTATDPTLSTATFLPVGFRMLDLQKSQGSFPAQAFLASGTLPMAGPAAVLALGVPWATFLNSYMSVFHELVPLPAYFNAGSGGGTQGPTIDNGYSSMYGGIREKVRQNLNRANNLPLYVVGQTQSSPLAQLAALDLRPDNLPSGVTIPSTVGYTFSSPAFGNATFTSILGQKVPSLFAVQAQGVDFYPTRPDATDGYFLGGQQEVLAARIPTYDAPWLERDEVFYGQALAGKGSTPTVTGATPPASSSGYSRDLSYTLALLSAIAYQRFQHPELPDDVPSPWTLLQDVKDGDGTVWASIFTSPGNVAAVFRGCVSWQEQIAIQGDVNFTTLDFLSGAGNLAEGAATLYADLRDALRSALSGAPGVSTASLYFAGHSFGGSLATLAALDQQVNTPSGVAAPAGVYTYGSPPVAMVDFTTYFGQQLGGMSFRVTRNQDVVPGLFVTRGLLQVQRQVSVPGNTSNDGFSFHPIDTYIALLDPR